LYSWTAESNNEAYVTRRIVDVSLFMPLVLNGNQSLGYFALGFSFVPILTSCAAIYGMTNGYLKLGKFSRLLMLLNLINLAWQSLAIAVDFYLVRELAFYRFVVGIHLLLVANYSEIEILQTFQVISGIPVKTTSRMKIFTIFYCYFMSWAAIAMHFVSIPGIGKIWSSYGLSVLAGTYILYDNVQIFYLLYLLYQENKRSRSTGGTTAGATKQQYRKIQICFLLVVLFDWTGLILWLIGYNSDRSDLSKSFSRMGESVAGTHVLLIAYCFHQIRAFTFFGKKLPSTVPQPPVSQ
jgi:hypothetical protein